MSTDTTTAPPAVYWRIMGTRSAPSFALHIALHSQGAVDIHQNARGVGVAYRYRFRPVTSGALVDLIHKAHNGCPANGNARVFANAPWHFWSWSGRYRGCKTAGAIGDYATEWSGQWKT